MYDFEIGGAECDVGVEVVDLAVVVVLQARLLRYPACGSRHQLHQARCADRRFGAGDKATLLPHQAVDPGVIDTDFFRFRAYLVGVRAEIAQIEIVHQRCLVGGVDGAIRQIVLKRECGGGEQLFIVHAANGPDPFAIGFSTHAEAIQRQRALQAGRRGGGADVGLQRLESDWRNDGRAPQFLRRKLTVKTEFCRDRLKQRPGFFRLACFTQGARFPIHPRRVFLCGWRHVLDRPRHQIPVARAQTSARHPLQIFVGELNVNCFVEPISRLADQLFRALIADLRPAPLTLGFGEWFFAVLLPERRRVARLLFRPASHCDQHQLTLRTGTGERFSRAAL